jgi:GR25 family glycosyltransferase involved in LPS biosynthesis
MKSFIIRLENYSNSVEWARRTFESGLKHNWTVDYFSGIDGKQRTLKDFDLLPNTAYKKNKTAFDRLGTVGCLLSHYLLWKHCVEINESICILEHDVTIHAPLPTLNFTDVIKLSTGPKAKPTPFGNWWGGAMAYCVSPQGASKLINFSKLHGVMPADVMLSDGIVDLKFFEPVNTLVTYVTDNFSFTWDLK